MLRRSADALAHVEAHDAPLTAAVVTAGSTLLVLLGLGGCDPRTTLTGQLTRPDGGAAVGATIRTVCSSQAGAMNAESGADGRFDTRGLGCVGADCRLEILEPDKPAVVLAVREHCRGTVIGCGRTCSNLDVRAVVP
jgi:hypothetical protein